MMDDPDKVAREIIERGKYEDAVGGLDSSIDSEEFDQEMRDVVDGGGEEAKGHGAAVSGDKADDFSKNTDLTYYSMMDPDEKLLTLRNRAKKLHDKHHEMMAEIKRCEALYPNKGW